MSPFLCHSLQFYCFLSSFSSLPSFFAVVMHCLFRFSLFASPFIGFFLGPCLAFHREWGSRKCCDSSGTAWLHTQISVRRGKLGKTGRRLRVGCAKGGRRKKEKLSKLLFPHAVGRSQSKDRSSRTKATTRGRDFHFAAVVSGVSA